MTDKKSLDVKIDKSIKDAEVFYPKDSKIGIGFEENLLNVDFGIGNSAVMLQISLN